MTPAVSPINEAFRRAAGGAAGGSAEGEPEGEAEGLDQPTQAEYKQMVELAAEICGAPISLITWLEEDRQQCKAAVGLRAEETGIWVALCIQAAGLAEITQAYVCSRSVQLFEVEDTRGDARFQTKQLMTDLGGVRFVAGTPLTGADGTILGLLSVLDVEPRRLSASQRGALQILSAKVRTRIEMRSKERQLAEALRVNEAILAELRASETALRASEDRFRAFMDHAPFVAFIKDEAGRLVFYNRRMAEQFGVSGAEWIGKEDREIWPEDVARRLRATDQEVLECGRLVERTEVTPDARGGMMEWKTYRFPWRNDCGEQLLGAIAVDMTSERLIRVALEEANHQLEQLATTDPLTGLGNRRVLDERVEFEFRMARRHGTALGVVLLDIDDFKRRNDRFGHASGDRVLSQLGALIASQLRPTDVAARYGGEEFVILLPGAQAHEAALFADRLRAAIARAQWLDGPLTASFGAVALDATTRSGTRLLALADDAMYEAKRSGKDRVVSHARIISRAMAELGGALAEQERFGERGLSATQGPSPHAVPSPPFSKPAYELQRVVA